MSGPPVQDTVREAAQWFRDGATFSSNTREIERLKRYAAALDALVEPTSRGDLQSPLRWTCRSVRRLAEELGRQGFVIGRQKVADLLHELGYSLQANRKTQEGAGHPDRNAQFEYINRRVKALQRRGQPVISVDTKKKELVGNFRNVGREWRPAGEPLEVQVHDFQDAELGKAIPYGVYDLTHNEAWVSVGIDHDTAEFAVETILRWWRKMGSKRFPDAHELLVTADSGVSNSAAVSAIQTGRQFRVACIGCLLCTTELRSAGACARATSIQSGRVYFFFCENDNTFTGVTPLPWPSPYWMAILTSCLA